MNLYGIHDKENNLDFFVDAFVFQIQSPLSLYSPGNSSKVAAIKRMRDAGWTAVTGCDKKKKKQDEKIFA